MNFGKTARQGVGNSAAAAEIAEAETVMGIDEDAASSGILAHVLRSSLQVRLADSGVPEVLETQPVTLYLAPFAA